MRRDLNLFFWETNLNLLLLAAVTHSDSASGQASPIDAASGKTKRYDLRAPVSWQLGLR